VFEIILFVLFSQNADFFMSLPKDACLILQLLDDVGVYYTDPKVIFQLVELNYSLKSVNCVYFLTGNMKSLLKDASIHAHRVHKTEISENEINLSIFLNSQTRHDLHPSPAEVLEVATLANGIPMEVQLQARPVPPSNISLPPQVFSFFFF
jgi:hypothetical protein